MPTERDLMELIDKAADALEPFSEAIRPDTISGWRFGRSPELLDFICARDVLALLRAVQAQGEAGN